MTYELSTGTFEDDPNLYFLKWGEDVLERPSGEITWSMNLDDLRHDSRFSRTNFEFAVQAAFSAWQSVTNLSFRMVEYDPNSSADIDIETDNASQVPNLSGSTVGLASYRYRSGADRDNDVAEIFSATIYMDSDNTWVPDDEGGLSFFAVVLHEIGHALGLDHVTDNTEIMNATVYATELGDGDIAGIQALYGVRESTVPDAPTDGDDMIDYSSYLTGQTIDAAAGNDVVQGSQAADRINGGGGNDIISGNSGADYIVDTLGVNALYGNVGNDVIVGGAGPLTANGGGSNDILLGGIGNDRLDGGSGNDTLRGDPANSFFAGRDVLIAGAGTDYLEGGGGADIFLFRTDDGTNVIGELAIDAGNPASTRAVGVDFQSGIDQIDLIDFGYSRASDVFANINDTGGRAVFADQGTTIVFHGLLESGLTTDDFLI
ncbi:matrixin family metalloprotease [Yoonia sediminilitoris]|uniref:Hemolysin type calcium-binding protein n=1 Tax=Yoonia sediminilitoris TaxID=1286148 RepID=A0A2T6KIG2_9RHOB|nr:matrixin family metalloprotease [Yoonia sediminilitoris]PUB15497.1 hemolysin type calcium-binding protein [Yoonia sediminilitoris]RCW96107.1 hemolysin type calcium-binding protein [Yoonia sediminilitoris]